MWKNVGSFAMEKREFLMEMNAFLWHTAILSKWKPVFEFIAIESQIEKFQDEYYDAIVR